MPAPNTAESFVEVLKGKVRREGWIHYYTFAGEEEEEDGSLVERVKQLFKERGIPVEVGNVRKCGHFAPYVHRYVLDLKVV
jgi:tRNA (guanine37-N1)-methyltransferase